MAMNDTLAPPAPPPRLSQIQNKSDRLSLPLPFRIPLACTLGGFSGFLLGLAKGSTDSGLRFQAENAHRLPSTQTGWYFYHKSKNYNMLLGGIVEGFKQSFKYSFWVGAFFLVEEGVDRGRAAGGRAWREVRGGEYRKGAGIHGVGDHVEERSVEGSRDCFGSMLAGLGTAGAFSAWNRFPLPTAARTAKMGAKAGLVFGLIQDVLNLAKGKKVGYIEFIKRHTIGVDEEEHPGITMPRQATTGPIEG